MRYRTCTRSNAGFWGGAGTRRFLLLKISAKAFSGMPNAMLWLSGPSKSAKSAKFKLQCSDLEDSGIRGIASDEDKALAEQGARI